MMVSSIRVLTTSQCHQCSLRTWGVNLHSSIIPIDTLSNSTLSP